MKLYVLVRDDLDHSYRFVQGAHAVAEYLLQHPNTPWRNGTMVFLSVPDI